MDLLVYRDVTPDNVRTGDLVCRPDDRLLPGRAVRVTRIVEEALGDDTDALWWELSGRREGKSRATVFGVKAGETVRVFAPWHTVNSAWGVIVASAIHQDMEPATRRSPAGQSGSLIVTVAGAHWTVEAIPVANPDGEAPEDGEG